MSGYAIFMKTVHALGLFPYARRLRIWRDHHSAGGIRKHAELRAFYSQFVSAGDLCFDVGANVGDRAEIFCELGARVVCVEPQADCVAVLQRRFRNAPVSIVQKALGEKEGTAELHVCAYNPGLTTLSDRWIHHGRYSGDYEWRRTVPIPMTTLDALVAEHGTPRFCKIDVEGFEESVLKGLSRPIPFLSFEYHAELFEEFARCVDRLSAIGEPSFNAALRDDVRMMLPAWASAANLTSALRQLPDPGTWGDVYVKFS